MADLSGDRGLAFAAIAVIDPAWAVQLVERLPDDPDLEARTTRRTPPAWAAAAALARHEARPAGSIPQHHYAYLWVADTEDIAGDL